MTNATADEGSVFSLIYASDAVAEMQIADLSSLLATARANNSSRGITGMLLYRSGRFLQILEGPETEVRERFSVIAADQRHRRVRLLVEEGITRRRFPDWTMGYPAVRESEVPHIVGFRSTFDDLDLSDESAESTVSARALRELARWFQERRASR